MKKRALSLLLALVMVLGMLPGTALAADEPAEVSSQSGLAAMGSGSYRLTADITLDGWSSIDFSGVLDGNGHTITLTGTPLFQKINAGAAVTNLILKGTVASENSAGSLAVISNGTVRNCLSYADVTYTGTGGSSYAPHYAAGLIGSASADSGTVVNCLYAGTLAPGAAPLYGSIANNQFFVSSTINYCVGVGSDRIGMAEGFSSHTVIDAGTNTVIDNPDSFIPADHVASFNANRSDGDLEWEVTDGALTLKAPAPAEAASEEEIAALRSAVSAAQDAVDAGTLYTAGSLSAFHSALAAAEGKLAETSPTKTSVVSAAAALTEAQAGLTERAAQAVALPGEGVIEVDQTYFNTYLDSPTAGAYYRLTEDITVTSSYWFGTFNTMNCVLDGDGHTITLANGTPLWKEIGENGVVQNLGILSAEGTVVTNSTNDTGAIAADCQGLIVNCWSRADVQSEGYNGILKNTGGFVANLRSGGAIVNCWNAGTVTAKGSTGTGVAGTIAGTAEANTLVRNCYWQNGGSAVGGGSCISSGNAAKSRSDFYSPDFIALLNENKGDNGKTWTLSGEGYPWFGEAQSYTPASGLEITFTAYDGTVTAFSSAEGLTIDLAARDSENYAGELSAQGVTSWENGSYDSTGQNNAVLLYDQDEDGKAEVYIYKAGSAVIRAGGAEFTLTVTEPRSAAALRLKAGDTVLEDGASLTLQGSEDVVFTAEARYEGSAEWVSIPAGVLTFTGGANTHVDGAAFHATAPGTTTVTAAGLGQSVTVNITSTYVPVTSIAPGPGGTYVIHGRNANSTGLGDFLDLTLSHGAGSVVVSPDNASYRDSWTLESSDPSVAEYVDAFLKAVLPKKAGTVTLTATSNDPRLAAPVTGSRTITLEYFNPVTSVAFGGGADFSVAENASVDLPLTFTGPKSEEGYHVTEPGMVWTQSSGDGGEVEITRRGNPGILVSTGLEYCVANDQYRISGVSQGTVTVTGTPVDTTGGAAPVTFTVTVTEGAEEIPADVDRLVADGISGAQAYLKADEPDPYAYGYEWNIFSLLRSGASISQSKLDAYLDSVAETYSAPDSEALKPTTLARVALTLGVLGEDASDFRGLNFIGQLCSNSHITDSSNEAMWALIALDSKAYEVPEGAAWTREALISEILRYQAGDGGFGLNDSQTVGVDVTAMALQALAPYYGANEQVQAAVDLALGWLKGQLDRNCVAGGTSESTAQVLTALAALGIDPVTVGENGFAASAARNLITALTGFQLENGGFQHTDAASAATSMSTIQALYSLEAYRRFAAGENSLYDLTDVNPSARALLENRLKEANSLIEGDYTEASWAAMAAARAAAQEVYDNEAASEEALMDAGGALAAAIAALEKVSGESGSGGSGDSIQVYVTISNAGELVMAQRAVTVKDYNENGSYDVDDALYAAHRAAYPGGASSGYASAEGPYGLSLTKLWGDDSGCFGYWRNHVSCWSLADPVAENDYLTAFVYADGLYWSDAYSKFDSHTYSAQAGEAVTLRLESAGYDEYWNTVFAPLAGAEITACQSDLTPVPSGDYTVTDTGSGTYSAVFNKAGTYYLAAYCGDPLTVPAVCQVTVTSPQGGGGTGGSSRITASISVKDPQGKTYLDRTSYTLAANATVYDLLRKTGLEITAAGSGSGVYIKAIEGLAEFDQGAGSGWMYRVNGVFPELSCGAYVLSDGDVVEWLYTRDLGDDVGGGASSDESGTESGAAAKAVRELIDAIGAVTADSGPAIAAARAAYDQLTAAQQKLVTNYGALTAAELAYAQLTGQLPFTDVEGHWAREAVRYVYERGLMSGTGSTTFSPDLTTTRGMIVTILYALEGRPAVSGGPVFGDVPPDAYYADAVTWAESCGIVSGYGGGVFGPEDPITREQLAAILRQYAAYKQYDVTAEADLSQFVDADQIGAWSFDALSWACGANMISGVGSQVLDPKGNATRAQAAVILMRYLENVAK